MLKPCLGALLTVEAASGHGHKGWIWGCNSAGKEEAWDCRETLLPRAEVPLTLPAGSEVSARLVLRQVQKAWDLLQQRLSPEPGP